MTATNRHSFENTGLRERYQEVGFGGRVGFGERPALLVIDMARAWTDPTCPIGADLGDVLTECVRVVAWARAADIPIFFTVMAYDPGLPEVGANIRAKNANMDWLVRGSEWVDLAPELERRPHEPLIEKQRGSAFFGTTLLSQLISKQVDTAIVVGCSTSGCIRATATDAHDQNLRVIVPRDAVGDRSASAHEANLFDIDSRYGDVVSMDEVERYLGRPRPTP
jgi:nicotinamidase-related amidase